MLCSTISYIFYILPVDIGCEVEVVLGVCISDESARGHMGSLENLKSEKLDPKTLACCEAESTSQDVDTSGI